MGNVGQIFRDYKAFLIKFLSMFFLCFLKNDSFSKIFRHVEYKKGIFNGQCLHYLQDLKP